MRLFVGVPLPENIREALWKRWQRIQQNDNLGNRTKAVEPHNYHITLKFIGDTPEQKVARIQRALEEIHVAEPFTIAVEGIGGFPTAANAKIVWAGIKDGFQELVALSEHIDTALSHEGVPRERRAFHPHITLARVKRGTADVTQHAKREDKFGSFKYGRFVLYKSVLTPKGPIYKALKQYGVIK